MSLTLSTDGNGEFEKLAKGIYHGTCYKIVDLGTTEQEYQDKKTKRTRIQLGFEITEAIDPSDNKVKMEDERPFAVFRTYTASLFEAAALRKDLESWRGKSFTDEELSGFDISKLLGCSARIEVGHTKATEYSTGGNPKILSLQRPDGGVTKLPTTNEQVKFDLDIYCDEWRGKMSDETKAMVDVFDALPEWQQKEIEQSFELIAAKEDGAKTTETKTQSNGLEDLKPEDDDLEDNIPF